MTPEDSHHRKFTASQDGEPVAPPPASRLLTQAYRPTSSEMAGNSSDSGENHLEIPQMVEYGETGESRSSEYLRSRRSRPLLPPIMPRPPSANYANPSTAMSLVDHQSPATVTPRNPRSLSLNGLDAYRSTNRGYTPANDPRLGESIAPGPLVMRRDSLSIGSILPMPFSSPTQQVAASVPTQAAAFPSPTATGRELSFAQPWTQTVLPPPQIRRAPVESSHSGPSSPKDRTAYPPAVRFRCDQCVESFATNGGLKRHKKIHSAKKYRCSCGARYIEKEKLLVSWALKFFTVS